MFYGLYANFVPYYWWTDFFDNLSTDLLETRIGRKKILNELDGLVLLLDNICVINLCMKINN